MKIYKFLLIEDSEEDIQVCKDTIDRMNDIYEKQCIEVDYASSFIAGLERLSDDYNGVIVDIKLEGDNSGNIIIENIINHHRIPVAIMTGTPDIQLSNGSPIKVFKKGEVTYEDVIASLIKTIDTGLFNVIGGRGKIENAMQEIFWNYIYPHVNEWEKLNSEGIDTEKILLRYAIAYLHEILDQEIPIYVPEEMYIRPIFAEQIKPGSILTNKNSLEYSIVLSPACDLVIHNERRKSDTILLCGIEKIDIVHLRIIGDKSPSKSKKEILKIIKNNHNNYLHWLPETSMFEGGYINFRKVSSVTEDELQKGYSLPILNVNDLFVKDIIGRFSSYYGRQGQPDFDFNREVDSLIEG